MQRWREQYLGPAEFMPAMALAELDQFFTLSRGNWRRRERMLSDHQHVAMAVPRLSAPAAACRTWLDGPPAAVGGHARGRDGRQRTQFRADARAHTLGSQRRGGKTCWSCKHNYGKHRRSALIGTACFGLQSWSGGVRVRAVFGLRSRRGGRRITRPVCHDVTQPLSWQHGQREFRPAPRCRNRMLVDADPPVPIGR